MRGEKEKEILRVLQMHLGTMDCRIKFYGYSKNEERKLKISFLEATENPEPNKFPDLLFDNGFIEHFQITSSKETKKGSSHTSCEKKFDREFENRVSKLDEDESVHFFESHSVVEHTHINLLDSLKQNCEKHLGSLDKSNKYYSESVFLIQYSDTGLETINNDDDTLKHRGGFTPYYPHLDKEILLFLQEKSNEIKHVVFAIVGNSVVSHTIGLSFEVFSTTNLKKIISKLEKGNYRFVTLKNLETAHEYFHNVPMSRIQTDK